MQLSIVTICIDPEKPIIERFLSSLKQYTNCEYELIIVDNAGIDNNTSKNLEEVADVYIRLHSRVSVAKAWNMAIAKCNGCYILVANDDVVLSQNWFENMSECFLKYKCVGLVAPVMNYSLLEQTHIGDIFHMDEACPIMLTPFEQFVWGAFMLFTKKSIASVNGFSEEYDIAGGEDLDMCFKLFEQNSTIWVDHRVFIYHEWGSTGTRILGDKRRKELYVKNYRKFKKKWIKYTKNW